MNIESKKRNVAVKKIVFEVQVDLRLTCEIRKFCSGWLAPRRAEIYAFAWYGLHSSLT
jgi:hypothetical protein